TLVGRPATELARAVANGDCTAREVTEAHLAHADARNAAVGALQVVRRDAALAEAARIDRRSASERLLPLAGVPVVVKDNIPVAGEPMRVGSVATPSSPSARDHAVVTRLRAAGAVIIGISRVPELCLWGTSDSDFGTARSPWRLDRTAGGSSGGSAAAVAAAMAPIAHGNDGLGSIRIPAACCGLVGIKPGPGIVPADLGENSWYGIAENGALATTVEDAALLLSVMAERPALASVAPPAAPLRIGLAIAPPAVGLPVDEVLAAHTRAVAALLASEGHVVDEIDAPMPSPAQLLGILGTWGAGARAEVEALLADDRTAWKRLQRRTRSHARMGTVARRLGLAHERYREQWRARMDDVLTRHDVIMTPTLARPPVAADGWRHRGWIANLVANLTYTPYCGPVNFARLPAIAVPAGVHPDGTPTSVHFIGRARSERTLLSLAAQVERLQPWTRHPPHNSV
ncbi:MAG: amidase, partial [Gemmatimonadaceae bacterium]|nr:amidase [Gemmatimonadaceae bacterium]